jgi:hypothetical protein
MSKKATDTISILSFTICGVLLLIRIIRVILFTLPPVTFLTVAIGFFFLFGWVFLLLSKNED